MTRVLLSIVLVMGVGLACGCTTSRNEDSGSNRAEIPVVESPEPFSCDGFELEDTSDEYDWSEYADAMLAKIRENWQIPMLARQGAKGSVKLRFVIKPDGDLACMDFLERSNLPSFDTNAWNAVAASQPFQSLPSDAPVTIGEVVNLTFHYNQKRSDGEGALTFEGGVASMPPVTD